MSLGVLIVLVALQLVSAADYNVSNTASTEYVINGASNPTLSLVIGKSYEFDIDASGHPFRIATAQEIGSNNSYDTGVTGNGADVGTLTFAVALGAPSTLYYNCELHGPMTGQIDIAAGATCAPIASGSSFNSSCAAAAVTSGDTCTLSCADGFTGSSVDHFCSDGTFLTTNEPSCTAAATCSDGVQNGDEEGIDCGGSSCPACDTATCSDGVQNGDEEGIDCGGSSCPACVCADIAGVAPDFNSTCESGADHTVCTLQCLEAPFESVVHTCAADGTWPSTLPPSACVPVYVCPALPNGPGYTSACSSGVVADGDTCALTCASGPTVTHTCVGGVWDATAAPPCGGLGGFTCCVTNPIPESRPLMQEFGDLTGVACSFYELGNTIPPTFVWGIATDAACARMGGDPKYKSLNCCPFDNCNCDLGDYNEDRSRDGEPHSDGNPTERPDVIEGNAITEDEIASASTLVLSLAVLFSWCVAL